MRAGAKLLTLANRARVKPDTATPYSLWVAVREQSTSYQGRIADTRHVFIHAGYLKGADGEPYSACPQCNEVLPVAA